MNNFPLKLKQKKLSEKIKSKFYNGVDVRFSYHSSVLISKVSFKLNKSLIG